jgi:hypothetical protein
MIVLVTHPFHPLAGQRLVVIFEKHRAGAERVLVCEGAEGRQNSIAALSWC